MDFVEGQDREQMFISSIEQMVDREAFVRIIDAFIDGLPLDQFDFKNLELNEQGRPPFHPGVLQKLYIYGYQNGIRSCRKLEHACRVNLEVIWLLRGRRPHYKTIANFRNQNALAFRQVFSHFVAMLKDWRLLEGKTIAIDSFKVRAQNSLKNNYNLAKIHRHLDYIDAKIDAYCEELDQADDDEEKEQLQAKINDQIDKWNQYCELGDEIIQSGKDQLSSTDHDAQAVILHRNIVNVGYNIQAASDAKHKLLTAFDTGDVNDTHALESMVLQVQENLEITKFDVLADKGYHTAAQLAACEDLNVTTYVSPKANAANVTNQVIPVEDFKYHPGSDTYRCPNGSILRSNEMIYHRKSKKPKHPATRFKHYRTADCKLCPIRSQCTNARNGRIIQRNEFQSAIDRNNKRVLKNPDYYRQRQQIIEHQFGTFKRQWDFTYVLMKGKDQILGEIALLFSTYNLRRTVSILGFSVFLKRLKDAFLTIFDNILLTVLMVRHIQLSFLTYPQLPQFKMLEIGILKEC